MPPQSRDRKPVITPRGKQLGAATLLCLLVVFLIVGTIVLGLYELHANGIAAWMRVP